LIRSETVLEVSRELHRRAATRIPEDVRGRLEEMLAEEKHPRPRYVLERILENYRVAAEEGRPMCSDTGLPRFYAKVGNEARIEGGMVALERALREATARATAQIPLRPNRVHPLSRLDHNNNVGAHAPTVDYSFEPGADWLDLTAVHKGGLFGGDYRMLFPADGAEGVKRFLLDTIAEFFRRGLACQPVTVGVGLGGTKDVCVRLAKEAASLRPVGDRHPDRQVSELEEELLALGSSTGFGVMGLRGDCAVLDVHVELAYAHTGGLPVAVQQFCYAQRRATARIVADGGVEYRDDPRWFTDYYRREGVT
jgi:L(+)-tartrate dehydratase alpha subunit